MTSPFGPLVVIVNPRCRRGRMEAKIPEIERILRNEGLDYRIVRTTHPGHATKAARDALQGAERYLVASEATEPSTRWSMGCSRTTSRSRQTPCSGSSPPALGATL
ncbi:MAG: diacylglycerol kinase family protein [Isosphaeraceae bacterium]